MSRATEVLALLVPLVVAAGAGNQDVNRDGRVNEADVKVVARMVAGLDPPDLSLDQNGDRVLTLDDVNLLVDAVREASAVGGPAGPPPGSPTATRPPTTAGAGLAAPPASESSGFFAVRQQATAQCVVVAGYQGISPGDTVLGVFPTFREAQATVTSQCADDPRPSRPPLTPAPPAVASLLASPILAAPKYDNDDSTEGIFFVSLETGNAFFVDKVKSSPRTVRTRALNQNVFQALGRSFGQSAHHGDILISPIREGNGEMHALLLVDATTGAMAYITDLDRRSYEGKLRRVEGRPAASLAGSDGQFALVMRRDSSGATAGAFLIHGTTGRCSYFAGIGELASKLEIRQTTPLPPMPGGISALAIQSSNEATSSMLLIDHGNGTLHHVGLANKRPWELELTTLAPKLFEMLPRQGSVPTPHRFVPIPITSSSGATESALVVDVGSGSTIVLEQLRDPRKTRLVRIDRSIYDILPRDVARPRVITAVDKVDSSGATEGAWLFDSVTGGIVFLDGLQSPEHLEIRTVEERAR